MILKYMSVDELHTRVSDLEAQLVKVQTRLTKPPAYAFYNPREDLALASSLHKYLAEVKAEIVRRHTGDANP